jgi:cellulose synthase/poly-beta-1,6-N-acetylglucosamine synthase-like glycosyltransferase
MKTTLSLRGILSGANRHAGKILLLGLAGVAWYNWRQWQRDRQRLDRRAALPPPPDPGTWPEQPLVSVLVAAWNEADMIDAHIRAFLALRYPRKELILCAGGDDGTCDLARRHAGSDVVVLEQQPGEGKQGALQHCLEQASGQVLFLTDADVLLDDDSFLRTLAPVAAGDEDVATGLSRPLESQLDLPYVIHQWCTETYAAAIGHSHYVTGIKGTNCALQRTALKALGGFQPGVRIGTDYHLAKQLLAHGYRIRHVPHSVNQTEYSESFVIHARRQSRWLRNLILHGRRFGAPAEVRATLRTAAVGLGMLLLPLVTPLLGIVAFCGWTLALAHSLLSKARYFAFTRAYHRLALDRRYFFWMPLYTLGDFVIWSRPLLDLVLNRERW